jgi:single-strand DNA-binding protein
MKGVNKCILIGTCGKDPDVRYTPSGSAVANVAIAINETWKDKAGQKKESTEWVNLVAFNRLAEIIQEYVKKGSSIYAEGKLRTRSWDQDGQKRYATEVVISEMQLLGGTKPHEKPQSNNQSHQGNFVEPVGMDDGFDDDIPF